MIFDFDFDFGMYPSNPPLRLRSLWQLSNLHAKTDEQLYYCIYLLVGLVNRKFIIWTFLLTYPSLFTSISFFFFELYSLPFQPSYNWQ